MLPARSLSPSAAPVASQTALSDRRPSIPLPFAPPGATNLSPASSVSPSLSYSPSSGCASLLDLPTPPPVTTAVPTSFKTSSAPEADGTLSLGLGDLLEGRENWASSSSTAAMDPNLLFGLDYPSPGAMGGGGNRIEVALQPPVLPPLPPVLPAGLPAASVSPSTTLSPAPLPPSKASPLPSFEPPRQRGWSPFVTSSSSQSAAASPYPALTLPALPPAPRSRSESVDSSAGGPVTGSRKRRSSVSTAALHSASPTAPRPQRARQGSIFGLSLGDLAVGLTTSPVPSPSTGEKGKKAGGGGKAEGGTWLDRLKEAEVRARMKKDEERALREAVRGLGGAGMGGGGEGQGQGQWGGGKL
ncbi:hypothetical protein JCM8547_008771 [Rhodosporidiobolus lusitaniae]